MVATFFRSPHSLSSCTDGNKVVRFSVDHIARVRLGKGLALNHSNRHVAHAVASKPTLSSRLEELLNKEGQICPALSTSKFRHYKIGPDALELSQDMTSAQAESSVMLGPSY